MEILLAATALALWTALGVALIAYITSLTKKMLSLANASLVAYLVIYPISGLVHVLRLGGDSRGFFDLLNAPNPELVSPVISAVVGLVSLGVPLLVRARRVAAARSIVNGPTMPFQPPASLLTLVASMVLIGPTVLASVQIHAYASSLDSTRILSVDPGLARVTFLSQWLVWAISFAALFVSSRLRTHPAVVVVIWLAATAIITSSLAWSGGRSIIVLMSVPLIVSIWTMLPGGYRKAIALIAGFGALAATVAGTTSRTSGSAATLGAVLDWQLGRFSMSGLAVQIVDVDGWQYGRTILAGVSQAVNGILSFLNVPPAFVGLPNVTSLVGGYLFGDDTQQYVVPGMSAELYINGGFPALVVGYALLGILIAAVDSGLARGRTLEGRLALGYVGAVVLFCTFNGQSGGAVSYLIYSGLPVFGVWFSLSLMKKVNKSGQVSQSLQPGSALAASGYKER